MRRSGLRGLRLVTDGYAAADWVAAREVDPGTHAVGSLVPPGFEAYARVLHPAYLGDDEVRWSTVAAANGRHAHRRMQWEAVAGDRRGLWDCSPEWGTLPARQAARLTDILARFTTSPECFYAIWDGIGAPAVPLDGADRVPMPGRAMVLLRGPLADAATVSLSDEPFEQGPHLWWPADRAWCVATDVDLMSTYVGASAACVEAIATDRALEAWRVAPADGTTIEDDELNRAPDRRTAK